MSEKRFSVFKRQNFAVLFIFQFLFLFFLGCFGFLSALRCFSIVQYRWFLCIWFSFVCWACHKFLSRSGCEDTNGTYYFATKLFWWFFQSLPFDDFLRKETNFKIFFFVSYFIYYLFKTKDLFFCIAFKYLKTSWAEFLKIFGKINHYIFGSKLAMEKLYIQLL